MSINKNIMKGSWGMNFILLGLFILPGVAFADHEPWFPDQLKTKGVLLGPGDSTYCNKDFMVENMSQETAEVQVLLGKDNYHFDIIEPDEKLAYFQSPTVQGNEKVGMVDDARIINTGFEAIRVHCR
jgi:hypothetical protein